MKYFSKDHEWLELSGDVATVGITDYAQQQLGDVVFVELPALGKAVKAAENVAVVESVKAASEVYTPVSGTIAALNDAIVATPALVNSAPLAEGWFFKITISNKDELAALMDEAAYKNHLAGL